MTCKFGIIGFNGYIASRHVDAIRDTGNELIAVNDILLTKELPVGVEFKENINEFFSYLKENKADWVSICSPNYLHKEHIKLALEHKLNVICEKPLALNTLDLDELRILEKASGKRVCTVLQLRKHPDLIALKNKIDSQSLRYDYNVKLSCITPRDKAYDETWKGNVSYSGGIETNIGIHFFDLMIWLFGNVEKIELFSKENKRVSGKLNLERASVDWFLSTEPSDLKLVGKEGSTKAHREILIDKESIEFGDNIQNLHTLVYQDALNGLGFSIKDALSSIDLVSKIRNSEITVKDS